MKPPKMSTVRRFRDIAPGKGLPRPSEKPAHGLPPFAPPGRDPTRKRRSCFRFRALEAGLGGGRGEIVQGWVQGRGYGWAEPGGSRRGASVPLTASRALPRWRLRLPSARGVVNGALASLDPTGPLLTPAQPAAPFHLSAPFS